MDVSKKTNQITQNIQSNSQESFCFPSFSIHGPFYNEDERTRTHRRAYTLSMIASGGYIDKQDLIEVLQYIEDMVSDE